LVVSPWAFGGVGAEFQTWCFVPIVFGLVCWGMLLPLDRKSKQALPLALVPMLLGLGLGCLQLLPVDQALRTFLSPQATEWRETLAPAAEPPTELPPGSRPVPIATPGQSSRQPLSIDPAATRRQLALLAMAVGAFALGARFFRHQHSQLVLCLAVAINGAGVACLGIVQRLSGNYAYFGGVTQTTGLFGSYFNENNAAGYLSMCLACGLIVLCWLLARNQAPAGPVFVDAILPLEPPRPASRWVQSWSQACSFVGSLRASTLAMWLVLGLLLAGVLCSLSRGAWLALAIAAPLAIFAVRRGKGLAAAYGSLAVAGIFSIGLIGWLGVSRVIERRTSTLLDLNGLASDGRLGNWAESLRALGDYWLLGSGLGTYGYAYLPYQERYHNAWHLHAENQYLEALLDGGAVGLILLGGQIALVLLALRKIFSERADAAAVGLVLGGMLLMLTASLHAVVDFGLYLPANFLLMATICGGFCGRATRLAKKDGSGSRFSLVALPASSVLSPALVSGLLVVAVLSWQETSHAAAVENALAAARWDENDSHQQVTTVRQAVDRLTPAVRNHWDDASAHLRLAQLWIELYRLNALQEFKRELPAQDQGQLWRLTDIAQLHARAADLASVQNIVELDRMRHQPLVARYLSEAWNHLLWARQACPWLAEVHLELAALCFLNGEPSVDQTHLEHVRLLAGHNPDYLYAIGLLELDDEQTAAAYRDFKASWTLDIRYHYDIILLLSRRLTLPQMLDLVVPSSPEIMIKMARETYAGPQHARERQLLMRRAEQLLSTLSMDPAEKFHARAGLELLKNNFSQALADYQRATQLRPYNANWRNEMEGLLQRIRAAERTHEAASQVPAGSDRDRGSPGTSIGIHP
jgi:O-antigen ligase